MKSTLIGMVKSIHGDIIKRGYRRSRGWLDAIKKEYGLVPMKGEPLKDFEGRVSETIHDMDDPSDNPVYMILKGRRGLCCTAEVQAITEKYLGIKHEPIDAFEGEIAVPGMGGGTLEGADGSAVMVIDEAPDNTQELIRHCADNLESMLSGGRIEYEMSKSNFAGVYLRAGFDAKNPMDNMYCQLFEECLSNPTFKKLHEAIHANHLNNHPMGIRSRQRTDADIMKKGLLTRIPIFGPIYKSRMFNFHVESESLAYKVGMDEYMIGHPGVEGAVDQAVRRMSHGSCSGMDAEARSELREYIKDSNSRLSKAIIREKYLNTRAKGYGEATTDYTKGLFEGVVGGLLLAGGPWTAGVGGVLLCNAANNLVKAPLAHYFDRKIGDCVDTIASLSERCGGAGAAFYISLGSDFRTMKKALVDISVLGYDGMDR